MFCELTRLESFEFYKEYIFRNMKKLVLFTERLNFFFLQNILMKTFFFSGIYEPIDIKIKYIEKLK